VPRHVDRQRDVGMQLVEAFNGVKDVVLADEPVRSLRAGDEVGLDPQRRGAGGEPLLDGGCGEEVVDACGGGEEDGGGHAGGVQRRVRRRRPWKDGAHLAGSRF
jgi:hypothetical protein